MATVKKNSKVARAAILQATNIRCYSLSNNFTGQPLAEQPVVWNPSFPGHTETITVSQSEFLQRELAGPRAKMSRDGNKFTISIHSNLWYEFTTACPDCGGDCDSILKAAEKSLDAAKPKIERKFVTHIGRYRILSTEYGFVVANESSELLGRFWVKQSQAENYAQQLLQKIELSEAKPKAMKIRLQYKDGSIYNWTIRKASGGWEFTDHENYTRHSEGNWLALVSKFKLVAENYGMTLMSELS